MMRYLYQNPDRPSSDPWDSKNVEDDNWSSLCKFQIQFKEAVDCRLTLRSIGKLHWKISFIRFASHIEVSKLTTVLPSTVRNEHGLNFKSAPHIIGEVLRFEGAYGGCLIYELSP